MGFNVDETSIPGLVTTKRVYLLGQSTYLNTMSCAIATIRAHITSLDPASHDPSKNTQRRGGFTFSQTLPYMENMPNHPYRGTTGSHRTPNPPPIPHQWTPKHIQGNLRLGAPMVHVSTCTTIDIDAGGTNETRAIMRADLVAIHTVLNTFAAREWIGIFTDSLSSLQAIRHTYTNPGSGGPCHYHHHNLRLGGITDFLEDGRRMDVNITLHKIRAHTIIKSNDLADADAELAVTSYNSLPPNQTLKVYMGEIAPCPPR